jgi:hypothetical protein
MRKLARSVFVSILLIASFGSAYGATVVVPADDFVTVDGVTYKLVSSMPTEPGPDLPDGAGVMWEWDGTKNQWKACICQMTAFRALQAVAQFAGISDIDSAATNIVTGWNTDGPVELYVDRMGWVEGDNFAYAEPITPSADLALADAWYALTIGGTTYRVQSRASNYSFTAQEDRDGHHQGWDFFDYRTAVQSGTATPVEKTYFQTVVRPQIVENFEGVTSFEVFGPLHQYGPVSFWSNAALFLDDPAMDAALAAAAEAAGACYEADDVKAFMAEMMKADFAAVAMTQDGAVTFYEEDGSIQGHCRYRYLGTETAWWGDFQLEWHKYRRLFCLPGQGSFRQVRAYRNLVATPVHQHGDGMTHAHVRYGTESFDELMNDPGNAMWWPTLALYGAATAESLAQEVMEAPEEWAAMLPPCTVPE